MSHAVLEVKDGLRALAPAEGLGIVAWLVDSLSRNVEQGSQHHVRARFPENTVFSGLHLRLLPWKMCDGGCGNLHAGGGVAKHARIVFPTTALPDAALIRARRNDTRSPSNADTVQDATPADSLDQTSTSRHLRAEIVEL